MKTPPHVLEYVRKFAGCPYFPVHGGTEGIEQIVVIPALAERDSLVETLASLASNDATELKRTLILCVINNRGRHAAASGDIENNQDTLRCLDALIKGLPLNLQDDHQKVAWQVLRQTQLRLAYIDASSAGCEMPDRFGGVGAARKIGMDAALELFDFNKTGKKLLLCLDADTVAATNYLEVTRTFFSRHDAEAAIVSFRHQRPADSHHRLAICLYEIYLRYYVAGLRYAGSPYSFHTIGSTIICTDEAYAAVGGMNRRDAAEDFYFLNKLAKYREINSICTTEVHPSARLSWRVPFGTGRRMIKSMASGGADDFLLYDPRIFFLIKHWLDAVKTAPDRGTAELLRLAEQIEPLLLSFLELHHFPEAWQRIKANVRNRDGLLRHFHSWFDGFRTLKLVHFLTDRGFPRINMFQAIEGLMEMITSSPSLRQSVSLSETGAIISMMF